MTSLRLSPFDTLFFRDGSPFNEGDPSQAATRGIFPPYPPTVVGAVRAALARAMGGPGTPWPVRLLGDGVDWQQGDSALGPLRFSGPLIVKKTLLVGKTQPLFPAPLHLAQADGSRHIVFLAPSRAALETEIGPIRLPAAQGENLKPLEGHWLDADTMAEALDCREFDRSRAIPESELWKSEPHVGICRGEHTHTTGEHALYAAAHVRLAAEVSLAVEVDGLPDNISLEDNPATLGGESRCVWIDQDEPIPLPAGRALHTDEDGILRYAVIHIAPADLGDRSPRVGDQLVGPYALPLPGRIVAGCVGRPAPIGGWDTQAKSPLALRPCIPAGSVWFMEAEAGEAEAALRWHGRAIGRATGWGFGRVLIGRWEPAKET